MIVDTSALVAILLGEADADIFERALASAAIRQISAVTRVELSFVIESRKGDAGRIDLEALLREGEFEVVAVTAQQASLAIEAFRRFGKGHHPAALNIGDCFSYALAKSAQENLLFKGNNFTRTDISPAV